MLTATHTREVRDLYPASIRSLSKSSHQEVILQQLHTLAGEFEHPEQPSLAGL